MSVTQQALLGVAVLFGLFMIWRYFQFRSGHHRIGREALAGVREKLKAARAAPSGSEKAALFVEAGESALGAKSPDLAVATYLRALRADPSNPRALGAIERVLAGRGGYRRLERICWRLLSRIPCEGPSRETYLAVWRALHRLYSGPFRKPVRARAIQELLTELDRGRSC